MFKDVLCYGNWLRDLDLASDSDFIKGSINVIQFQLNGQEIESYETPVLNDFVQIILNIIFLN